MAPGPAAPSGVGIGERGGATATGGGDWGVEGGQKAAWLVGNRSGFQGLSGFVPFGGLAGGKGVGDHFVAQQNVHDPLPAFTSTCFPFSDEKSDIEHT